MTGQALEERLLDYMHSNYAGPQFPEVDNIYPDEEAVAVVDGKRIMYFRNTTPTGQLVNVIVPGILVNENYRRDTNGNAHSLVRPVDDDLKPALERTILVELAKMFGVVLPDKIKFGYWSYSDFPIQTLPNRLSSVDNV